MALDDGIPQDEFGRVILLGLMTAGFPELVTGLKRTHEVIQAGGVGPR